MMANLREEQERLANAEIPAKEELPFKQEPQVLDLGVQGELSPFRIGRNIGRGGFGVVYSKPYREPESLLAVEAVKSNFSVALEESWVRNRLPASEIAEIQALATRVFDDEEAALVWLQEPNLATNNQPPITLLGTAGGYEHVQNLLLRIQYGILA